MVNYCNDDQTVPQETFEVNKVLSHCKTTGGSVVDVSKQSLAFDSLDPFFNDIADTVESLAQSYLMETPSSIAELSGFQSDFFSDNDMPFYDDKPSDLVKVETEDFFYYPSKDNQSTQAQSSAPISFTDDNAQAVLASLKMEIECVGAILNIPADPYAWAAEQVQTWMSWTLHQQYPMLSISIDSFEVDGPSFCLMSETEFVDKFSPALGRHLFVQLQAWKANSSRLDCVPQYIELEPMYPNTGSLESTTQFGAALSPQKEDTQSSLQYAMIPSLVAELASPKSDDSSMSQSFDFETMDVGTLPVDLQMPYRSVKEEQKHTITPTKQNIHLWQFLKELLLQPQAYSNCIRWLDQGKGIFKIEDSSRVAKLWGQRKNRPAMNYDKLSRSIRQYYKKGIIRKTDNSKRLVYQFCPPYRT